jgi:hypothetical protein
MPTLKSYVASGNRVQFVMYRKGELFYRVEAFDKEVDGFEFPVPIEDVGDGVFLREDKAMLFMRYIRKHLESIASEKATTL